jgi:hypothetical protein
MPITATNPFWGLVLLDAYSDRQSLTCTCTFTLTLPRQHPAALSSLIPLQGIPSPLALWRPAARAMHRANSAAASQVCLPVFLWRPIVTDNRRHFQPRRALWSSRCRSHVKRPITTEHAAKRLAKTTETGRAEKQGAPAKGATTVLSALLYSQLRFSTLADGQAGRRADG